MIYRIIIVLLAISLMANGQEPMKINVQNSAVALHSQYLKTIARYTEPFFLRHRHSPVRHAFGAIRNQQRSPCISWNG